MGLSLNSVKKSVSNAVKNPIKAYKNILVKPTEIGISGVKKGLGEVSKVIGTNQTNQLATGFAAGYGVPPVVSSQVLGQINPSASLKNIMDRKAPFSESTSPQNNYQVAPQSSNKILLIVGGGIAFLAILFLVIKRK